MANTKSIKDIKAHNAKVTLRAISVIANQSIQTLCESFELTNNEDGSTTPTVREWIMNELEKRDPNAFAAWIECEDVALMDYPSKFFLVESATQNK